MQRLATSALYGFLLTLYGGSMYYFLGYLWTIAQGGDVVKFAHDTFIGCILAFAFFTFFLWELSGRLNQPRNKDKDSDDNDKRMDK